MLRMDQYEHIRTANRVYGHSLSKISRDTGHSRNTIRKALQSEVQSCKPRKSQSLPRLGPFSQIIEQWLVADKDQPKNDVYAAIELALAATISNSDGIKHILLANQETLDKTESLSDRPTLADADTSIYGQF